MVLLYLHSNTIDLIKKKIKFGNLFCRFVVSVWMLQVGVGSRCFEVLEVGVSSCWWCRCFEVLEVGVSRCWK